jgi:acyl-Coa thioesterase superfamily protein/acyl-CoA thioesterase superfamily protein
MTMPDAFFVPDGEGFVSTELTRGPWDPGAQHGGPPTALLARAIERCEPRDGMRVGRMTFEILRPVPIASLRTEARVARPGRRVELLEGSLVDDRGPVIRASAWRMMAPTQPIVAEPEPAPPGPERGTQFGPFLDGPLGYLSAVEWRFLRGGFLEPGAAIGWCRMRAPLVEGEEPSPLQRVLVAADSGNGISAVSDWRHTWFINVDLNVFLLRPPEGEWVCLDAETWLEPHGPGLATSTLYDERGRIGRAVQTLFVGTR